MTDAIDDAAVSAAPASARYGLKWWREVLYVLAFYLVYSWIRNRFGSAAVSPDRAFDNARRVIDVEKMLGLFHEETIQHWFVSADLPTHPAALHFGFPGARFFIQFWNVFYGTFHFIVTGGALIWLYRRFPSDYRKWRNVLAITTGLALLGFSLYPLMPPRLLADCGQFGACAHYSFVDSLAHVGSLWSFDSGTMQRVSNQYAAMPSLHFAWAGWCFFVLYPRLENKAAKALVATYPWLTLFAIIVTANHYWLDAAGGALLLTVGYLAGSAATRVFDRRFAPRGAWSMPRAEEYGAG